MIIETIYDSGTVKLKEDSFYIPAIPFSTGFIGVADGVSGLYEPSSGPLLFDKKSGGQMASQTLIKEISQAQETSSLKSVLIKANNEIYKNQQPYGFYSQAVAYNKTELLAGTTFAIAKITKEVIEIAQCGDSFALWMTNSSVGNNCINITENQLFIHDMKAKEEIAKLMLKHNGDRDLMWQEFSLILSKMRRKNVNQPGGYGLLNGEIKSFRFWQTVLLPKKNVKLLILFTDGLVYYPETEEPKRLAKKMLNFWEQGGLSYVLQKTREQEKNQKSLSHVDHSEATAIAIKF